MINLIFSMDGPRLTDGQADVFQKFARWVVLNERNGRLLVDGIGDASAVSSVLGMLAARTPVVIGAWDINGVPVQGYPLNEAAWLAVAPDELDTTDPQNPVAVRPTAFREVHKWAGWGDKQ